MGQFDLAIFVREQKSFGSLKHSQPSSLESCRMFAGANSFAAGFDPDHAHVRIIQKRMEQTDGIAAATDTGDKQIGQALFAFENLRFCFLANHTLKIAHHHGVGMGSQRAA